jgi:hypothetical protein
MYFLDNIISEIVMILLEMKGLYIALIVIICGLGVIFLAIPDVMESDLWFVAVLDLLANWVLVWELTSFCHFIEGVRHKNMFGMEVATLRI